MHRLLRSGVGAVLAASVLLLAGCAAHAAPPAPLSHDEKMLRLEQTFDVYWKSILATHPDAVRPKVKVVQIATSAQWVELMTNCLHKAGAINVIVTPEGGVDIQGSGTNSSALDIAQYACTVQYPRMEDFNAFLSDSQLGALYDYDVGFLQPCLVSFGYQAVAAPSRSAFIHSYYGNYSWSPYNGLQFSLTRLGSGGIFHRCPADPAWLTRL